MLRDEPVKDIGELFSSDNFDPDVWPSPIPADHSYSTRYVVLKSYKVFIIILFVYKKWPI